MECHGVAGVSGVAMDSDLRDFGACRVNQPTGHNDAAGHVAAMGPGSATPPAFTLAYLRSCGDAVAVLNPAGRVGFLNARARRLLGIGETSDVVCRSWWDLWGTTDAATIRDGFERATLGQLVRIDLRVPERSERTGRLSMTLSPVINLGGTTESVLAVARIAPD